MHNKYIYIVDIINNYMSCKIKNSSIDIIDKKIMQEIYDFLINIKHMATLLFNKIDDIVINYFCQHVNIYGSKGKIISRTFNLLETISYTNMSIVPSFVLDTMIYNKRDINILQSIVHTCNTNICLILMCFKYYSQNVLHVPKIIQLEIIYKSIIIIIRATDLYF